MIVIPGVDIRRGRCVRLREGRAEAETVFSEDPVAMARRWVDLGASRLHVVDLDGAFGESRQTRLVVKLIEAVAPVPVQVGGGLRDMDVVDEVLAAGARWAVVGTRAALDPDFLSAVCGAHAGRIIMAVDGRGPRVAVKGWTEVLEQSVVELAVRARQAGAVSVLYTDVTRDGTGRGPNLEDTAVLARAVELPILASGGVSDLDDLRRLAAIAGVTGAIVGRALYTGTIDLRQAQDAVAGRPAPRASEG